MFGNYGIQNERQNILKKINSKKLEFTNSLLTEAKIETFK